jgi:nucleoside-diphosphate-sugar epimerase
MKALVTGGTGFIGRHVVKILLQEGHRVRLFSRHTETPQEFRNKYLEMFQGDFTDVSSVLDALDGIEIFYHIGEIKNRSKAAARKNVRLVEQIIESLPGKKVKRMVFISSITVSGIPSEIPASEDTLPEISLKDLYTDYKRTCEDIIAAMPRNVEYSIIRPGFVYGGGSRPLGKLISTVEKLGPFGFPFIGGGQTLAPFIQVNDLAQSIYLSGVKFSAAGQVLNITDGLRHSWFDFFHTIAESLGKSLRIIPVPPLLLKFPAIFADFFAGIFGIDFNLSAYTDFFSRDIHFSNSKARNSLGWDPQYTDFPAAVREMVLAYREGQGY